MQPKKLLEQPSLCGRKFKFDTKEYLRLEPNIWFVWVQDNYEVIKSAVMITILESFYDLYYGEVV